MQSLLETIKEWDSSLFLTLNGAHSPFWDEIMWWASEKYTWWPFYLLLIILFFLLFCL